MNYTMHVIDDPTFSHFAYGTALNSAGLVALAMQPEQANDVVGYLYDAQGGLQPLGELSPGEALVASAINSAGDIAGSTLPSQKAWVRRGQDAPVDLSSLFDGLPAAMVTQLTDTATQSLVTLPDAELCALNDQGQVVGRSSAGIVVYKNGASVTIPIDPEIAYPKAMNDSGIIIVTSGYLYDPLDSVAGWRHVSDLIDDAKGWTIDLVQAMNDSGQILATATKAEVVRPVLLTPAHQTLGDLPRLRGVMRILFSIINDAPGLGISGGGHPHRVGSGPDDPEGPRRSLFSLLSAGQRDTMLGLCIGELGAALSRGDLNRETRALAARIVGGAAHHLDPLFAREQPGASRAAIDADSARATPQSRREDVDARLAALRARPARR